MRLGLVAALAASLLLAACGSGGKPSALPTEGVTDALIAAADGNEWLTYGRDYAEQRFSPLTQVGDANVSRLGLAWSADLDTARGQEATPLMHGGVLYVSTAWSMVRRIAVAWHSSPMRPSGRTAPRRPSQTSPR